MSNLNTRDIRDGIYKSHYRGVPIQKFPFDYLIYQMILHEVKPDLIIEIGTMWGGSALYFADLMDAMNIEGGEVHTIDIVDLERRRQADAKEYPEAASNPEYPKIINSNSRIKTFTGGFQSYDLDNCKKFNKILVIDDGSHKYEEVLEALNKFEKVVSIGSYFIVEDGNALELELSKEHIEYLNGGPLRAIVAFLNKSVSFTMDLNWCDMYGINSTYNTYGYLKKIR
jgi:cephalosporin hydroxylase